MWLQVAWQPAPRVQSPLGWVSTGPYNLSTVAKTSFDVVDFTIYLNALLASTGNPNRVPDPRMCVRPGGQGGGWVGGKEQGQDGGGQGRGLGQGGKAGAGARGGGRAGPRVRVRVRGMYKSCAAVLHCCTVLYCTVPPGTAMP